MTDKNIDFGDLLGPEWAGIWTNGQYLFLPGWRAGYTPQELRAQFWLVQERFQLKYDVERLQRELERREAELERLEREREFYRRQCRLEAQLGLMLARVAG